VCCVAVGYAPCVRFSGSQIAVGVFQALELECGRALTYMEKN